MIRKAQNSIGKYDLLFKFLATNRLSIVVYSLIVLLSVGLVYCCVCVCDLNVVGCVCVCDLNVVGCVCDLNVVGLFAPSFILKTRSIEPYDPEGEDDTIRCGLKG
jgi:hypothetical protein